MIALYGPIDPGVWGPVPFQGLPQPAYDRSGYRQLRGNVVVLQGDQPCVPCNRSGCDRHDGSASLCLDTMAPERVLDEVARLLDA